MKMKQFTKIKNRIYALVLVLVLTVACFPLGMFDFGEVEAAGESKEVKTYDELKAALANSSYSTIIVAADITIPFNTANSKSTTAYLTADRNVTIQGKDDGHDYVIKRAPGSSNSKSILEVWGNGYYDGVTVNIYDLTFDGGAVWTTDNIPNRYNYRSQYNTGAYGRAIIDVANKGTLNLESGAVIQNGDTTTNATTRVSTGTAYIESGSASYGGGIRVDFQTGGTVNLKAKSSITDCVSGGWGGGIGAYNYARLNLYGGSIKRCATNMGGGIAVTYRGNTATNTAGTIKVFGGEISDCYSRGDGGALVFSGNVSCYLLGGTFKNNTTYNSNGGGVLYASDNVKVYLADYSYFTCSGNTAGNYKGYGWAEANGIYKKTATITSAPVVTVTFKSDGATYTTLQCVMGGSLGEAFPGDPHKTNSIFHGWYNGSTQFTKNSQVQSAITVTAKWHTHNYSYAADGNVIKLICSGENDCPYKISIPKLTLTGPTTKEYDRGRFTGIHAVNDITAISGDTPSSISYEKADGSGTQSTIAPMDIGKYKAKVTLGGATAVYDFAITKEAPSNFEAEPLNNKINDEGKLINHITGGEEAKADLKLFFHNSDDVIDLYKIAEISWSENNYDYYDPEWVEPVANWIAESSYASQQSYLTPLSVGAHNANDQSIFYNNMLAPLSSLFTPAENKESLTKLTGLSVSGPTLDSEKNMYYNIYSDLEPGVYAAVSPRGAYTPCVVSILPQRSGPNSGWYLDALYTAYIKSAAVNVNKYINSEDLADTIAVGEQVNFKIEFGFTSLYTDRITLSSTDKTVKDYTLYAEDTMSPAYRMVEENGQIVLPTLQYYVKNSDGNIKTALTDVPDTQAFYQFADSSFTAASRTALTDDNAATYLYDGTSLYTANKAQGVFAIEKNEPIYTISDPTVVNGITTFRIDYNVSALKGLIKSLHEDVNKVVFVLSYDAIVTDAAKINSEENTNKITLNYEKTKDALDDIIDTVYGFTYGVNVVKVDGNSLNEDETVYLDGAKFRLYKEVAEKPAEGTVTYEYNDDKKGEIRYFVLCTSAYLGSGNTYDSDGCFTSVASSEGIMLSGLKEGNYILEEFSAPFGYTDLDSDIYFEINKLNDDDAQQYYNGFYKSFMQLGEDGIGQTINDTGYIKLEILNFRGLTLPSTGGAGTLLFTIIGIVMMMSVMIILVVRRHTRSAADYM